MDRDAMDTKRNTTGGTGRLNLFSYYKTVQEKSLNVPTTTQLRSFAPTGVTVTAAKSSIPKMGSGSGLEQHNTKPSHVEQIRTTKIPLKSTQYEAAATGKLETTRKERKMCSICNRDYSSAYIRQHKRKVHAEPQASGSSSSKPDETKAPRRSTRLTLAGMKNLEKTLPYVTLENVTENKTYVGARKECGVCGKEYSASYIKKHISRAHLDTEQE